MDDSKSRLPPEPTALRVLETRPELCVAIAGNVLVILWHTPASAEPFEAMVHAVDALMREHPSGLGVLAIAREPQLIDDPAIRQRAAALIQRWGPRVLAYANVIADLPAEQAQASIGAMLQIAGATVGPAKFFSSWVEGADWLESFLQSTGKLVPPGLRLRPLVEGLLPAGK